MKTIRLAILLLLIPLCCVAFAALVKTSTIGDAEVDPWQKVLAGTLVVGNVGDISGSYDSFVVLEIVYADTDAQDGVPVKVEVSYGDDNWILWMEFTTPGGAAQTGTFLDDGQSDGDTSISLIDASGFEVLGQKWFIEDNTPANSESVRTANGQPGDNILICQDLIRPHADTTSLAWEFVHEFIIPIPASFAAFRVTIHDIDDNADIYFTTRKSEVKGL